MAIVANMQATNQAATAASTAAVTDTIATTAVTATMNIFIAKYIKLELSGKFVGDTSKL